MIEINIREDRVGEGGLAVFRKLSKIEIQALIFVIETITRIKRLKKEVPGEC